MRIRTIALSTASFTALIVATPAMAQSTATTDPNATAQTNPAADATATTPDPATDDAIVVTGLRRSLQSAKNIKRNSDQQVDAIVAEDIGKLPDIAVAETAARIPGLQVVRRGGEADSVLVRGLPDFATTYNGREIFTAETRVVALQDFPSANIAALEVFKTSTADLVEAGLAGEVNVRSRRPFDFKGTEIAGSLWALYTKQAREWTPNVNLLASTRWGVGDGGEMGLLLNYSRTELSYLDSEPSNTDFIAPSPSGRLPDIQRLFYRQGNRVRPSINGAFQWRINPDIQVYVEGLYQGFRNRIADRLWEQPLYGGVQSNIVYRPGTDLISRGTVTNPGGDIFTFQGATYNKTDTYQFAAGGSYDLGRLKLTGDVARTKSTFRGSTESFDRVFRPTGTVVVNFDNEVPQFSYGALPGINDPANFVFRGLFEEAQKAAGDDWQARLDGTYETGLSFIPTIQAGVRYTDRDAFRRYGNRYPFFLPLNVSAAQLPTFYVPSDPGFRGTDVQSGFRSWLSPTYDGIRDNIAALRQFIISRCPALVAIDPPNGCVAFTTGDPVANPNSTYRANEKSYAGYLQAKYAIGENIDGVIGIRAVQTKSEVAGTTNRAGQPAVPVDESNKYTDWLPNASVRWRMTPGLQLRLAATQTRTKPNFSDLNPAVDFGQPVGQCDANGNSTSTDPFGCVRNGGGGNPFLKPFTSNNYDASLEYYFGRTGLIAGAVFRRDLKGFFQNQTIRYVDPIIGPVSRTQPVNTNSGRIDGAEAQVSTFFEWDFVPKFLRGFGAQANVTYLDTSVRDPNPIIGDRDIYGVSKWTYNLVGMYEGGGFSARVSYNKRGKFLGFIDVRDNNNPASFGGDYYYQYGKPAGRLDLSTSYTLNDKFTVFGDWTNILERPYKEYLSSARNGAARADYIRFRRYEETTFSIGVRARL
ncbi:TonB-dependent receptor [Sphingomonas rosea]|uniref:TonB-dependent receptor n=1 Tax=Sphingomonas rosea TaxID=335605 RepID=A0ABP7TMP2_9SPHN